jgi:hypothetical protein
MLDCHFAEEIKFFVLVLFHKDNASGIEEWKTLAPIKFGVLSWHLGNYYCCPMW